MAATSQTHIRKVSFTILNRTDGFIPQKRLERKKREEKAEQGVASKLKKAILSIARYFRDDEKK